MGAAASPRRTPHSARDPSPAAAASIGTQTSCSRIPGDVGQKSLEVSPPEHHVDERRYYDAYEVEPGIRGYRLGSSGPR